MGKNKKVSRETCPRCGAKMTKFRHSLSRMSGTILKKIYSNMNRIQVVHIGKLDMSYNEKNNLQKLQYWDIIRSKKRHSGSWELTDRGRKFVEGEITLKKFVWTYRGNVVNFDGPDVRFGDLIEKKYDRAEDYSKRSKPMNLHGPAQLIDQLDFDLYENRARSDK